MTLLIRSSGTAHMRRRLDEVLRYVRFFRPGFTADNLTAVSGDVTRERLGLPEHEYARLARCVTHVVHSAASVDLAGSYGALRHSNLVGTRHVSRFAEQCRDLSCLLVLSTAYVAGRRSGDILERELDCGQDFLNHYERSKFDAELLVRSRSDQVPTVIVRPSIVVGDSRDGHVLSFQHMYVPLYYIGAGAIREHPGDQEALLDVVPVDYVAEVVTRVLAAPACVGNVYHACGGVENLLPFASLRDAARLALTERAPGARSPRSGPSSSPALVRRLSHLFQYLGSTKRFSVAELARDLGDQAPRCPHPEDYLPRLMAFWRSTDFGRRMPWADPRPAAAERDALREAGGRC